MLASGLMPALTAPQKRSLTSFYLAGGLIEFIPIYPLYAIMILAHGVSPAELGWLLAIWSATVVVFEVPSGVLADRFSRKWLIVFSAFLKASAFVLWYFQQNFAGYAFGFFLWGFASSLRSGAWEALLYELLKEWQHEAGYTKHYARITSFSYWAVALGELTGGLLISQGYSIVLLVSAAIAASTALPFIFFVRDARPAKRLDLSDKEGDSAKGDEELTYLQTLITGFSEVLASRQLVFIVLVFSLLIMSYGVYDEFVSPSLHERGFSLSYVGYIGALVYSFAGMGSFIAGLAGFKFKVDKQHYLLKFYLLSCMSLLFFTVDKYVFVVALALFSFATAFVATSYSGFMQSLINDEARSTATSVVSLAEEVAGITGLLLFGYCAETVGILNTTYYLVAYVGVVSIVLLLTLKFYLADEMIQRTGR